MMIDLIKNKLSYSRFSTYQNHYDQFQGRKLTQDDINQLIHQGNFSGNWSKIEVTDKFNLSHIWHNFFMDSIRIGDMDGNSGIYFSTIKNSRIGNNCFIKNTNFIYNYFVDDDCQLTNNGDIIFENYSKLILGKWIEASNEIKSREIFVYEELLLDEAKFMALRAHTAQIRHSLDASIHQYQNHLIAEKGYIGKKSIIKNTGEILNSYIAAASRINNITALRDSVLWCDEENPILLKDRSLIEKSLLQWGCKVESMSIVQSSIMLEHSTVERHGKLTLSFLGPNSLLAEGEITSSFCGPFIAMHHQSLLVAAYWPEGKGNMAYGANVGSNHTAKAPDQEIWIGEGLFWGLGVNVKFPCNFIKSPYSIIAAGALVLPQKVEMPFSLINLPAHRFEHISPAYNEILPAWVLSDDMFMVLRNSLKYRKRDKAIRNKMIYDIFRKDILQWVIEARTALQKINIIKNVYTLADIPSIGKNYLTEFNRQKAIQTYSFFIKYYALLFLYLKTEEYLDEEKNMDAIYSISGNNDYDFAMEILLREYPDHSIQDYLLEFAKMKQQVAHEVLESKQKDDIRGRKIIDDYDEVMILSEDNEFVSFMLEEARTYQLKIENLLYRLG